MAEGKKGPTSIVTQLINLSVNSGAEFFRSPDGELYATVPAGNPTVETLPLGDRDFRQWLARVYYKKAEKGVGGGQVADAVMTLGGIAQNGATHDVYTRVAALEDRVYLDLGRDDHQTVEIDGDGWRVAECPRDVRFVRRQGTLPLPDPVKGRRACTVIPEVINVPPGSTGVMMITAWLVGVLRGIKPYPILVIAGEQGSGKSMACRLSREFVDPNQANLSLTPKEARDMLITARNSHVIGFDNLSFVPDWLSDVLCSIATGAGFRTRTLTTDSTETIFSAARPIVMNAITDIVRRGDLMDRAMVVETESIPEEQRQTEARVEARFRKVRAEVLGSLASAVSQALRESVELTRLPRMADFAVTVESAAPALGWAPGQFLEVYAQTRREASEVLLEGDLVATALQRIHRDDQGRTWRGSTEELRERILKVTHEKKHEDLPRTPKSLINHLRRAIPALRTMGIEVGLPKVEWRDGRAVRQMTITYPGAQPPIEFEVKKVEDGEM